MSANLHMCKYPCTLILAISMLCMMSAGTSLAQEKGDFRKKLESLIIEHVEFDNVSIKTAVEDLRKIARDADPDKKEMNILLLLEKDKKAEDFTVTLNLDKVSLDTVLEYTAKSAGLSFFVKGNVAVIAGKNIGKDAMEIRTFRVNYGIIKDAGGAGSKDDAGKEK